MSEQTTITALAPEALRRYWKSGPGAEAFGEPAEADYEYAAFNDEAVVAPQFADGKIPDNMRFIVDEPLATGTLWSVARWARLTNETRMSSPDLYDRSGLVVVRRRTIVRTPWADVSYEEINEALEI